MRAVIAVVLLTVAACGGGGDGGAADAPAGPVADAADPDAAPDDPSQVDADEGPWELAGEPDDDLFADERDARDALIGAHIEVVGVVVAAGAPVAGARVRIGDAIAITDAAGRFGVHGLARRNRLVHVEADGHRVVELPVHLARPVAEARVDLGEIPLTPTGGGVRLLFAGDTSFGRRFMDPEALTPFDEVPPSNPDALVDSADPAPGSVAVLDHVRPWFDAVDYPIVNLESVVTATPATPHPTKDFVYFTLPGSLAALSSVGVRYVSLGNNHVFDYLEPGVLDTHAHLDAAGIAHSGLGSTPAEAFAPYRVTLGGTPYALVSMTSISGTDHPPIYVAAEPPEVPEVKGGAADLRQDDAVTATIAAAAAAGDVVIAQLHTGQEYTFSPGAYARGRMELVAQAGASLVVAHHPHVAQGFAWVGDVLVLHSLGNFCFDQDRLETMLSYVAVIDLDGGTVRGAQALPIYLEDYAPRPALGRLAHYLLRRIGEVSLPGGVAVATAHGRGLIGPGAATATTREVDVPVTVDASGAAVVDLRAVLRPGESLARATLAVAGATAAPGEDLLVHGDVEDWDVDGDALEAARWDTSAPSSFVCVHAPRDGVAALCSTRHGGNVDDSIVPLRNRVRVLGAATGAPNKDVTLFGYVRGDNAGAVRMVVRYHASEGEVEHGEEVAVTVPAGTYAWRPFAAPLAFPADVVAPTDPGSATQNPHAVRLFLRHAPPLVGDAVVRYDDLALISWRAAGALDAGLELAAPNPIDFLRVTAPPGAHILRVVLTAHAPAAPAL